MVIPGQFIDATGSGNADTFAAALLSALPPIYDRDDPNTLIQTLYNAVGQELAKADRLLASIANNNYISIPIADELIVRGSSTSDRLANENAFELDAIRLSPSTTLLFQNVILTVGLNNIQLNYVPAVIDFVIFTVGSTINNPVNFPTSFNSTTNVLTITASAAGAYTVGYQDTGDAIRITENVTVPSGLFLIGFGENGFNFLGFGD